MYRLVTQGLGVVAALTLATSCSQPLGAREKGVLAGGGLGAATGAIIGSATGNPGAGAAIGGALGGVAGGLVGDQLQRQDRALAEQQQVLERQERELLRNREILAELRRQDLEARETDRGVVVNVPDVFFEFGRAELTTQAYGRVREIADVLNTNAPHRLVSVEGHTDSVGSEVSNQQLSERRAEAVAGALQVAGVSASRITTHGFGERYPVAPNTYPNGVDNPAGRSQNRRVEVVIQN
ncbi:MAG: OmpA family protein [Candidatus Binatia bacterium]